MTDTATATTTTVPAETLEQARAKLEKAHSILYPMLHSVIYKKSLHMTASDGSLQGYYGRLRDINAAIEEMLAATAQANQTND